MIHKNKIINIIDNIPVRFNVGVMLFMACLISYMLRVNLSINILAMVQPKQDTKNLTFDSLTTIAEIPNYGTRYNWTASDQSILLGSYFWGYIMTSILGGILSERFGGRTIVGLSLIFSGIFTALTPISASLGFWAIYICRLCVGIVGGVLYPALHNLVSKWAPPNEKGKFVSSLMGGTFGTVITWPLSGIIVETIGWDFAFYIPAIITGFITIAWYYFVADTPSDHKRITSDEKEYIEKSLIGVSKNNKKWPPLLQVATSLPYWALLILHYGNLWGLYFLITAAPKFVNEVLGFNLAKAGFLSALPYLMRMIFGFIFGSIGDVIRKKNWMGVTFIRKFFCIFSHIIPGLFLIGLTFIGETQSPYICVAIITLSLGFNGSSTVTNLQNSQDLAPNFSGTLYGIINCVGTTTGFITPLVVAYFTQEENTIEQWSKIFMIGSGAYIIPAFIFAIFGSGNVQKWNETEKIKSTTENNP